MKFDSDEYMRLRVEQLQDTMNSLQGKLNHSVDVSPVTQTNIAADDYSDLFHNTEDVLFIHEIFTGKIIRVNNRVEQVFGVEPKTLLGSTIGPMSQEEKGFSDEFALEVIQKSVRDGHERVEWQARDTAGQEFHTLVNLRPIKYGGNQAALASVRDISSEVAARERMEVLERERKILQARASVISRFSLIVDAIPEAIWVCDPVGRISYCNNRFFEITGLSRLNQDSWMDLVHEEDRAEFRRGWIKSLTLGDTFEQEFRLDRHFSNAINGSAGASKQRWYRARAVARREPEGYIAEWYGTITDISSRR